MALDRGHLYKRGAVWWVKWTPERGGKPRYESTGKRNKVAAEARAAKMIRHEQLRLEGVEVPDDEADLQELADVWRDYLLRIRNRSQDHVNRSADTVLDFLNDERIHHPQALNFASAERWLERRRADEGWSSRTYNRHRGYLRAWGRWLCERARVLPSNPFAGVHPQPKRPVIKRRALDDGDDGQLVSGQGRLLIEKAPWPWPVIYLTILSTGLRRNEVAQIALKDLGLKKRALVIRWEVAKAKREDVLPITAELARELQAFVQHYEAGHDEHPRDVARIKAMAAQGMSVDAISKELRRDGSKTARGGRWWWHKVDEVLNPEPRKLRPEEPLFSRELSRKLTHTLYRHLVEAGIPQNTPEGRIDLQALRKTFAVQLRRRGVDSVSIQRLMRHTDPRLTTVTYQSFDLTDLRGAVDLRHA